MAEFQIRICALHEQPVVGGIITRDPAYREGGRCPIGMRLWPEYEPDSDNPSKNQKPDGYVPCEFADATVTFDA